MKTHPVWITPITIITKTPRCLRRWQVQDGPLPQSLLDEVNFHPQQNETKNKWVCLVESKGTLGPILYDSWRFLWLQPASLKPLAGIITSQSFRKMSSSQRLTKEKFRTSQTKTKNVSKRILQPKQIAK